MAKGISLHIGLNRVDPNAYNGWSGVLSGCQNDAKAMKQIADACGYTSQIMFDDAATSDAVINAIGQAAQQLSAGDYYLLTYSGHGGQVDDTNGDEDDNLDETWVLYDRMLIDDELYSLWSQFAAGVRIFMLSDSCHSGTVARDMYVQMHETIKRSYRGMPSAPRLKKIPSDISRAVEKRDAKLYRTLQWVSGNSRDLPVSASVVLISGCMDNQLSQDGDTNGLFTQNLLEVWNNGAYDGDYRGFHSAISAKMPPSQTPNYFKVGVDDYTFESHRPFDILGGQSVQPSPQPSPSTSLTNPTVTGPSSISATDDPPSFQIDLGGNPYFILEICSDASLFDNPPSANNNQYYGTWNDSAAPARLQGTSYQLSADAWALVNGNDTLYFRVCTTSSATGWDDFRVSDKCTMSVQTSRARGVPTPTPTRKPPRRPHAQDLP